MMHEVPLASVVLDVLRELIRIPSVNPSIAPDEGHGEGVIASFACDWLNANGVRAWIEEAAPDRPNVVAEVGSGTPVLVLCAHLDTVGTAGMTIPPFEPTLKDGRVYGRGSYDMKGSAAAVMTAAAILAEERLAGRVTVALVADEEYASVGAMDFVRRHRADACVVTEPADGRLILAHKGFLWARVTTRGRAAHGSRWDLGVSAIAKMASVISALEDFDRTELRNRIDSLVGPASLHCALINGGVGLSTYAPECQLEVERRTLPGEAIADVRRELKEVVRRVSEDATVECFFDRPPLKCDADTPIANSVRRAIEHVTGRLPDDAGVGYWMDAAVFAEAGIPTVNYGPTGGGAHEVVEWVDLDSVITCARVLTRAAHLFCTRA